MILGVSLTEGMRRFAASRRTVDSLTCRCAASCLAVKNSSRSSVIEGSLRLGRYIESYAINCSAVDLDVLRHRLRAFGLHTHTIFSRIGRQSKLERPGFCRDATVDLFRGSIFKNS